MGLREWFAGWNTRPSETAAPAPEPKQKVRTRLSQNARTKIGAGLAMVEPQWRKTGTARELSFLLERGMPLDPVFRNVAEALILGLGFEVLRIADDFPSLAASPKCSDENLLLAVASAASSIPTHGRYGEARTFNVRGDDLREFVNQVLVADGYHLRVTSTGYEPAAGEREVKPEDKFKTLRAYSELSVDFEAWSKDGEPMAFLFFDIDNFKPYNSRLTEAVVDDVILGPLHRLVKKEVGSRGGAYAMGKGDEFGALLRNVTPEEARVFAKRLHGVIATASFRGPMAPEQVTVSIGIACFPRDASTMENLRLKANGAEHDAKAGGKKCIFEHGLGRVT